MMRTDLIRLARRGLLGVIVVMAALAAWAIWQGGAGLFGPAQTLRGRTIGIVAGHSGHDSGAVCPDGLTEAEVNSRIAEITARELRRRGAAVDLLAEFDPRLRGYRAAAFVSIHADSCSVDLSGFKVASLAGGAAASTRLVDCLWQEYAAATGLSPHPDTITYDMRDYHAFREIATDTAAAIIEVGFMQGDRELLTRRPALPAAGIVAGIECALRP
jgi:N-acetylmuramoyl-L-alanine amidase